MLCCSSPGKPTHSAAFTWGRWVIAPTGSWGSWGTERLTGLWRLHCHLRRTLACDCSSSLERGCPEFSVSKRVPGPEQQSGICQPPCPRPQHRAFCGAVTISSSIKLLFLTPHADCTSCLPVPVWKLMSHLVWFKLPCLPKRLASC